LRPLPGAAGLVGLLLRRPELAPEGAGLPAIEALGELGDPGVIDRDILPEPEEFGIGRRRLEGLEEPGRELGILAGAEGRVGDPVLLGAAAVHPASGRSPDRPGAAGRVIASGVPDLRPASPLIGLHGPPSGVWGDRGPPRSRRSLATTPVAY